MSLSDSIVCVQSTNDLKNANGMQELLDTAFLDNDSFLLPEKHLSKLRCSLVSILTEHFYMLKAENS